MKNEQVDGMAKIYTLTCHDVYNVGAGLQAFALQKYLLDKGNDVEIIDYKPVYLSGHYSLFTINNPKYRKPVINILYLIAKLPNRIKRLISQRKKRFDLFKKEYLLLTSKKYSSNSEMFDQFQDADIFIVGSDQVWNPLFQNGKDPAFFLDFASDSKVKISYAASFATDQLSEEDEKRMYPLLSRFDEISVRESRGIELLNKMGLNAICVCDPVILIDQDVWKSLAVYQNNRKKYIFYYDFDNNSKVQAVIRKYADEMNYDVLSVTYAEGMIYCRDMGPLEFLGYIMNAEIIVTNSYHATVFSVIFHKPFYVFSRKENLNSRIEDFITYLELQNKCYSLNSLGSIEYSWEEIDEKVIKLREKSEDYLQKWISKEGIDNG